jgi:hypothetical protein
MHWEKNMVEQKDLETREAEALIAEVEARGGKIERVVNTGHDSGYQYFTVVYSERKPVNIWDYCR